ncbi:MAG TPA: response regulator transcription factor [Chthonomonadales bacterium]|nr:response regulator transcription factor [Chthonomonadales bacterium]
MKVLVVDDELPIVEAVSYNLRREGYEALTATDAEQCMDAVRVQKPDLVILDVMLPTASGFDVCRLLRKHSAVPIIMLTARADETDRVVGLELGADDYVTKPFSMRELMARVRGVLRRTGPTPHSSPSDMVVIGDIVIDMGRHEVEVRGAPVALSRKEFELLAFLAANPDQAFTRQVLLDRVWGADAYVGDRTVDVHVRWLREKVEADPSRPVHLLTLRGLGYKLVRG